MLQEIAILAWTLASKFLQLPYHYSKYSAVKALNYKFSSFGFSLILNNRSNYERWMRFNGLFIFKLCSNDHWKCCINCLMNFTSQWPTVTDWVNNIECCCFAFSLQTNFENVQQCGKVKFIQWQPPNNNTLVQWKANSGQNRNSMKMHLNCIEK